MLYRLLARRGRHDAPPAGARLSLLLVGALVGLIGCAGPEAIVHEAVAAARAGDRAAYAACFTERSRPILEVFWRAADLHNPPLARLGAGEVVIESVRTARSRDLDGERAIVGILEGTARMRLVLHRVGNTWRIDLLDTEKAAMGISNL